MPAAERTGSSSSPILLGAAGGAGAGLILSLAAGGFGAVLVPIGAVGGAFVGSRQASSKALAAQQYNEEIRRAVQTILKRKLKEVRTSADRAKAEAESGLASVADQLSRTVLEVHTRNAGTTVEWRRRLADILKRAEIELKG